MLCDKEKDWLLKKIDEESPRGEGEPAHPVFQLYKENDKVHDLVWRLIETQRSLNEKKQKIIIKMSFIRSIKNWSG